MITSGLSASRSRRRIFPLAVDTGGPWSATTDTNNDNRSPTAAIAGGFARSSGAPPPKSPLQQSRRRCSGEQSPVAATASHTGVRSLLLRQHMNVTTSTAYITPERTFETPSRPLPSQLAPPVLEVSAAQNHKARKAAEAKRRLEVTLMTREDYTGTPDGLARLGRQAERASMQEEDVRMARLVQAEHAAVRAQQLATEREEEARVRATFLAKARAAQAEQARLALERDVTRKRATEDKMKALKAAADAKARDEYAARQRELAAHALVEREERLCEVEQAQLAVEDALALALRQDALLEQERTQQIAAEAATWKRFEAAEAERLRAATVTRRAAQAAQYEQDKQRRMQIHRLQQERARLVTEKQQQHHEPSTSACGVEEQPHDSVAVATAAGSDVDDDQAAAEQEAEAVDRHNALEAPQCVDDKALSEDASCSSDDKQPHEDDDNTVRETEAPVADVTVSDDVRELLVAASASPLDSPVETLEPVHGPPFVQPDAVGVRPLLSDADGDVLLQSSASESDRRDEAAAPVSRLPFEPLLMSANDARARALHPFATVLHVQDGSPAIEATLRAGDLLLDFGGVTSTTPNCLLRIAERVKSAVGCEIALTVLRPYAANDELFEVDALVLRPRKWAGKGLLGCQLNPFKWVEEEDDDEKEALEPATASLNLLVFCDVALDSAAAQIGIMSGDLITQCDALEPPYVADVDAVIGCLEAARNAHASVSLELQRWLPDEQRYERLSVTVPPDNERLGCSFTTFTEFYDTNVSASSTLPAACTECYYTSLATAVHAAALNGHVSCLDALLTAVDDDDTGALDWRDDDGRSPLFYACYAQQLACAQLLLARGAVVDPLSGGDAYGDSPLHAAAMSGSVALLTLLLEQDVVAVDAVNAAGLTCAHVAPTVDVLELLSERFHADLLAVDVDGRLPLAHACLRGDLASVQFLCARHPDFADYADASGNTPLHLAAWRGRDDVLQELVTHVPKIALHLPNQDGATPLDVARASGCDAAVQFLSQYMADDDGDDEAVMT